MPIRKPSNRGGNHIGMYYSSRLQRSLPYESTGQRDCLTLINYYKDTIWFDTEPLKIPYLWNGKQYHYTPDILVKRIAKPQLLIECKPLKRAYTEENERKYQAAREYCCGNYMVFEVWITEKIRAGFPLKNVNWLSRFSRHKVDEKLKQLFIKTFTSANVPISVATLAYQVDKVNYYDRVDDIFCMVFNHELYMDIEKEKINPLSYVYLPTE